MWIGRLLALPLVAVLMLMTPGVAEVTFGQAMPPAGPPDSVEMASPDPGVTPARISYISGEVSFWRPGAADWAAARVNTPLAPGDVLATGTSGHVEIQTGPRAFVRAGENSQMGLDSQQRDFLQLRLVSGHAALDLREIAPGGTVEVDTPGAAFTVAQPGYYRVDVADSVTFAVHGGGRATMTREPGSATVVAPNQQVILTGSDVLTGPAPELSAWDRWNDARTAYLLQPTTTAANVPVGVYGTQDLDQYGTWSVTTTYGPLWTPRAVPVGWTPYSTGRWLWDPLYGWTWLDDAPWGWAPYHHGRWLFVGSRWAWAPGPRLVRPVYAPALVVFLGGVTVSVGRPVAWAPLGWGEPVVPWWGRRGFVGVPWWGGWGGPRVVNNVVVHSTTVVQPVTVYRNVHVVNAVVSVPADRFGRGPASVVRVSRDEIRELHPVRGVVPVTPVAASLVPDTRSLRVPASSAPSRPVVAVRPPQDLKPTLRSNAVAPSPRPDAPRPGTAAVRPAHPERTTVAPPTSSGAPVQGHAPADPAPRAPAPRGDPEPRRAVPPVERGVAGRPEQSAGADVPRPNAPPARRGFEGAPQRPVVPPRAPAPAAPSIAPRPAAPDQASPDRRGNAAPMPAPRGEPSRRIETQERRANAERHWRGVATSNNGAASHGATSPRARREGLASPHGRDR